MALTPGTRVGAYEVVNPLGAGGMGEVYRARDTNLGRDVAIKILPDVFAADPDRLARFEREARVLAQLNHPNIATIHGLERSGAAACLVMELVPGETLAARIARGRVPVDEALPIAIQIAQALEAAHDKGIVHRDLKPANIIVEPGGKVKVLDFGLAKAIADDPADVRGVRLQPDLTASPTIAHAGTLAGVILGTAAYMSPEQARGKSVDKRADIWAFGCVLFEMLAGKPAFGGETLTDIVAAVVKNDPDWRDLPTGTPPHVRTMLRRCLKKEPAERLHDVADARIELLEPPTNEQPTPPSLSPRSNRAPWVLAALFATTSAALVAFLIVGRKPADLPMMRVELSPPPGVELVSWLTQSVCVSPDGATVGFVGVSGGGRQIYLRRFTQSESTVVQGSESVNSCFFSPDGRSIGFVPSSLLLKTVSLADGQVSTVAAGANYTSGGAWGPDGRITYGANGELWQVAPTGRDARRVAALDAAKGEIGFVWPTPVDNGRSLLVTSVAGTNRPKTRIEAVAVDTGARRVLVEDAAFPIYAASGHLVFFRNGALHAAPFDVTRLQLTGPAARLVTDVASDMFGGAEAALSATGTLVYIPSTAAQNRLVSVSREGLERPIGESAHLDAALVAKLKRQAAAHGRSTEAEHREILRDSLKGGRRRVPLKEHLRAIPDVGTDEDFARVQHKGRRVRRRSTGCQS